MSAQKNLAFIGLGLMGLPMASHLGKVVLIQRS
jgi:3-hydroxyisobutyrate dehydrogenase-like beta-hydroxyacid dehydrogenase